MKRTTAVLLAACVLFSACLNRRGSASVATGGSLVSAPRGCAASNGIGRLTLLLPSEPSVPDTSEALVRLQGETERSSVRVNARLGTTFELRPGSYRLSISLPGYKSAERSLRMECGSERTLAVPLTRKR